MKDQTMTEPIDHSRLPLSPWAPIAVIAGLIGIALLTINIGGTIGIAAIVCASVARHDIKRGLKAGRGWATAGIWLGALALAGSFAYHMANA